jgi:hypothetical protein
MQTVKEFLVRLQIWIWSLPQWKAISLGLLAPIVVLVSVALLGVTAILIAALVDTIDVGVRLGFTTRFLMALLFWTAVVYFARKIGRFFLTRAANQPDGNVCVRFNLRRHHAARLTCGLRLMSRTLTFQDRLFATA